MNVATATRRSRFVGFEALTVEALRELRNEKDNTDCKIEGREQTNKLRR